jgi:hypothetical protein
MGTDDDCGGLSSKKPIPFSAPPPARARRGWLLAKWPGTLEEDGKFTSCLWYSEGYANSTVYGQRTTHVTLGSGVYGQGSPRVLEFGLKFTF